MDAHIVDHPVVSVFGSYSAAPGDPLYETAYRLGRELAAAGYAVCNGGYGGTMAASAKGAKEAGGSTLGVTCCIFSDDAGLPLKPNPWIDREFCADNLFQRIDQMMRLSAAFVVLEGGTGTLAEFAIVWEYVCKKLMAARPIILVGDFWQPLVERIRGLRPKSCRQLHCLDSVDQVVRCLRENVPISAA